MIYLKSDEEIALIRNSSLLVGKTLAEVARNIRPGVTTQFLDQVAETFIRDHKAIPGFKGYKGFPATLCISINEQVVHGIPGSREMKEGDLVSIDCGVLNDGYYGDSAYSFAVGEVSNEVKQLMNATKESLYLGIEQAVHGKRTGDIGNAIQTYVERLGFSVVRELVGHGVGKHLHESPEVSNFGKKGQGMLLTVGMVIAIEPMINLGKRHVIQEKDGWTIRTADRKPSAHYEHTIAIRKNKTEILSSFEEIEKVLNEN
ncbi:MAG: type I methionyl aminopeptidase [Bacteroidales bacterium]|nr:type I methionyl aminopeptidase [Bacteroidales bacterium]MDZ4204438.1 type I methionyl aminopeptidase [Bacteroidales bacterium]